jgi:hypothetical protein
MSKYAGKEDAQDSSHRIVTRINKEYLYFWVYTCYTSCGVTSDTDKRYRTGSWFCLLYREDDSYDCRNDNLCHRDDLYAWVVDVRIRTNIDLPWSRVDGSYELGDRGPLGGEKLRLPALMPILCGLGIYAQWAPDLRLKPEAPHQTLIYAISVKFPGIEPGSLSGYPGLHHVL